MNFSHTTSKLILTFWWRKTRLINNWLQVTCTAVFPGQRYTITRVLSRPFPETKKTKRNSAWELERSFGDSLSPLHSTTHPFPCDCWIHGWLKVRHFADVPTTDTSSTPKLPSKEELKTHQFLKQTWDKVNSTKALPCLDIRKKADFEGVGAHLPPASAKSDTKTGCAYH